MNFRVAEELAKLDAEWRQAAFGANRRSEVWFLPRRPRRAQRSIPCIDPIFAFFAIFVVKIPRIKPRLRFGYLSSSWSAAREAGADFAVLRRRLEPPSL
ncbi:MAG: hypothetical protein JWM88_3138 [Verrucomicrobia bacterium]|nr:hypothetical protein [Verrucomicrobiota bacterium]